MSNHFNRDTILNDLRQTVIEVHFEKVNGDMRTMRATLKQDLLPQPYNMQADENFHNQNPNVIACWDVQANGWRSFRVDSVKYMQDLGDNYI